MSRSRKKGPYIHESLRKKVLAMLKSGDRRVIKTWLKAGVMENGAWFPTEEGTPQGGVCSPLLANIALHGLEEAITAAFPQFAHGERWKPTVVRYADDFVGAT